MQRGPERRGEHVRSVSGKQKIRKRNARNIHQQIEWEQ